jgi:hypothetical protein
MIQIDDRIDEARLRQWASQAEAASPNVQHVIDESFLWEQGPEYYHGQVAALAFAYQAASDAKLRGMIGAALARVSKHIVDKGWWDGKGGE